MTYMLYQYNVKYRVSTRQQRRLLMNIILNMSAKAFQIYFINLLTHILKNNFFK